MRRLQGSKLNMGKTVNKILDDFGEKLVTDLRNKLRAKGVTFGGGQDSKLAAKTEFEINQGAEGIEFLLTMPPEYYWVNKGRKPGPVSKEAKQSISSWASRKAIVGDFASKDLDRRNKLQSISKAKGTRTKYKKLKKLPFAKALKALTFVVSAGIQKNGYEPTYFLDEVLNDGRLKQLEQDLKDAVNAEFITQIRINNGTFS